MEIRELTAADLFKLSEIAEKISVDLVDNLSEEVNEKKMGLTMLLAVLRYVPKEIKEFLAYVTDQTPEELDKKPFVEPIKIVRALYEKEDFKDFLQELNSLREIALKKQPT